MKRAPQLLAFALGGVIALTLLQSVSACSETSRLSNVDNLQVTVATIDRAGTKELGRFYSTLDKYSNKPNDGRERDHFRDAYRHIRANYVREVIDTKIIDAAIKGVTNFKPDTGKTDPDELVEVALDSMLASLDPHSQYLSPDELKERRVFASGEFGGLGIQVTMEEGLVKVIAPIEDTPADRAGIKAGDLISHLDGRPIEGIALSDAVKIMRGRVGTKINLTVIRKGMDVFDVTISRAIIHVRSVRWRVEKDIGYIRISSFTEQTEPGLIKAFVGINKEAGSKIRGYVLDLRNNPGGLLDQAIIVSDMFLDNGEIVSIRPRRQDFARAYTAEYGDMTGGKPVVVLVNEGSASASEIVAGAIKDNLRGLIMGRRSFGKGSVQTIQQLPIEGALQLTTALYYFPSGRSIQARGVVPDIVIDVPPKEETPKEAKVKLNTEQNEDKKELRIMRESDLPGAINAEGEEGAAVEAHLKISSCPAAGVENDDRELGCAIAYINAESPEAFFAAIDGGLLAKPSSM